MDLQFELKNGALKLQNSCQQTDAIGERIKSLIQECEQEECRIIIGIGQFQVGGAYRNVLDISLIRAIFQCFCAPLISTLNQEQKSHNDILEKLNKIQEQQQDKLEIQVLKILVVYVREKQLEMQLISNLTAKIKQENFLISPKEEDILQWWINSQLQMVAALFLTIIFNSERNFSNINEVGNLTFKKIPNLLTEFQKIQNKLQIKIREQEKQDLMRFVGYEGTRSFVSPFVSYNPEGHQNLPYHQAPLNYFNQLDFYKSDQQFLNQRPVAPISQIQFMRHQNFEYPVQAAQFTPYMRNKVNIPPYHPHYTPIYPNYNNFSYSNRPYYFNEIYYTHQPYMMSNPQQYGNYYQNFHMTPSPQTEGLLYPPHELGFHNSDSLQAFKNFESMINLTQNMVNNEHSRLTAPTNEMQHQLTPEFTQSKINPPKTFGEDLSPSLNQNKQIFEKIERTDLSPKSENQKVDQENQQSQFHKDALIPQSEKTNEINPQQVLLNFGKNKIENSNRNELFQSRTQTVNPPIQEKAVGLTVYSKSQIDQSTKIDLKKRNQNTNYLRDINIKALNNSFKFSSYSQLKLQLKQQIRITREQFMHLTIDLMKRPKRYANKQLHDTLMNYFIENNIGPILQPHFPGQNLRDIQQFVFRNGQAGTGMQFMNNINYVVYEIMKNQSELDYESMLLSIISEDPEEKYKENFERWATIVRKQILCLLLLVHLYHPSREQVFTNFQQLWDVLYPEQPLSKRKSFYVLKSFDGLTQTEQKNTSQFSPQLDENKLTPLSSFKEQKKFKEFLQYSKAVSRNQCLHDQEQIEEQEEDEIENDSPKHNAKSRRQRDQTDDQNFRTLKKQSNDNPNQSFETNVPIDFQGSMPTTPPPFQTQMTTQGNEKGSQNNKSQIQSAEGNNRCSGRVIQQINRFDQNK